MRKSDDKRKSDSTAPFIHSLISHSTQRALGTFHPFHISAAFCQRCAAAAAAFPTWEREHCPGEESVPFRAVINGLSMGRPWPIGQLRPPDSPGLIKKGPHNRITGQINDPLMKSPTKQAKTARPTYVFHHAAALTFPLAQPPRQTQLGGALDAEKGRPRRRKREEKNDSAAPDTTKPRSPPTPPSSLPPPPPTRGPFSDFWPNKSICCHTVPLRPPLTHTWAESEEPRRSRGWQRRGPYAAEAAHLVAQPFVRPIPGASPSIFVSPGQMGKDRGGRKFFFFGFVLFCL